jgi:hypothetical protein
MALASADSLEVAGPVANATPPATSDIAAVTQLAQS